MKLKSGQKEKPHEKAVSGNYAPEKEATPMKLLPASDLFDCIQDLSNSIARRAFEIFEGRGRAFGHDLEDWLRAESEFLHPIHLDIAESDDAVTVRTEVPGFSAKELDVGVEPHRLTISGKREAKEDRTSKKTIYSEHCRNQSSAPSICLRRLTRRRLRPTSRMECWNSRCRRLPRRTRSKWKKSRRKVPSARSALGQSISAKVCTYRCEGEKP